MKRDFLPHIYRSGLVTLALVLLALPFQSCLAPTSMICPSGRVCPIGQKCAANQDVCITTDCGDGITQTSEACDDGNILDGDGCNQTCKSNERCGNGVEDTFVGEVCDDGNTQDGDTCSADCRSLGLCGNGIKDPGEECDDGDDSDEDNCLSSGIGSSKCILATCGDGKVDKERPHVEECDPADSSDTSVPCNLDCTPARCGDGIVSASIGEECDGGDRSGNPTRRDTATCDDDCTIVRCGDGHKNTAAGEACDDGNADACGTCNANCSQSQEPKAASGSITVKHNSIKSGTILSISDGHKWLFFEFVKISNPDTNNVPITIDNSYSAERVAEEIMNTINKDQGAKDILVTAKIYPTDEQYVELKNTKDGSIGNQPIITSVEENEGLSITGMNDGVDACPNGVGCTNDNDRICESRYCDISSDQTRGTCRTLP